MNNIVAIHLIDENRLDQRHYFKSLTEYHTFAVFLPKITLLGCNRNYYRC